MENKNTFIEHLRSDEKFLWQMKRHGKNHGVMQVISIPDKISGVRHVYIGRYLDKNFEYSGTLIGEIIYKENHTFRTYQECFGVEFGSIDDIQKDIVYRISEQVTQKIYDKAYKLAKKAVAFAKKDIARMKAEPLTQAELRSNSFDYREHEPKANKKIIDNLLYNSSHLAKGKALKAFYNGGFNDDKKDLVKVEISERNVLMYLALTEKKREKLLNTFVAAITTRTKQQLDSGKSYLIEMLAVEIIAKEYYKKLLADKDGEHYLIKEIYDKVWSDDLLNAKTVNITVAVEGEVFTFNIERNQIRHENDISMCYVMPATIREQIKQQLRKRCERTGEWQSNKLLLSDILEITYKKKSIYKKELV